MPAAVREVQGALSTSRRLPPPLWLLALLLAGLGVRLLALDAQPLWWDEGYSLYFATETPLRLLELTSLDIHPPLYYLLLQGWLALTGSGAIQARLLSVFLGVLALPAMWVVARRWIGRSRARLATLLLAFAPFHVYYSQEVRMYALVTLLALLVVAAWQRRSWALLGLAAAGGLLTHYYFVLFLLALALLVARDVRRGEHGWRGPRRAILLATAAFLPWLLYSGFRLLRYISGKLVVESDQPMSPVEFIPRHLIAWSVGHLPEGWTWLAWAALPFALLALSALYAARRTSGQGGGARGILRPALLWLLPVLATFLVNLVAPFDAARIERQLLYVLPFFLLLVAYGLGMARSRHPVLFAVLLAFLLAAQVAALLPFYAVPRYPGEDYRPLLARVGAEQGPGDGWLAIYPWQIGYLRAYLPGTHPTPIMADIAWDAEDGQRQEVVASLLREHPRLWFPAYQVQGRLFEEKLAATLNATGVQAWNEWLGNTRLYLYGAAPPVPALEPAGEFASAGAASAALAGDHVATGIGVLPVFFEVAAPAEGVRASVQLVGRGAVWGEWDDVVREGVMRAGLPVAHGAPPGEYSVQLTLYDQATGVPLERFVAGERQAPEAPLGTVSVTRAPVTLPAAALQRLASRPMQQLLGGSVRLLGYSLGRSERLQGEQAPVTLFWQAVETPGRELNVFVQALDEAGVVRAARDIAPVNGTFPTGQWQAGDLVRDPHLLDLPADLPPGDYRLIAGLYDPATGERLATSEGENALLLGSLRVAARTRVMEEPQIGVVGDLPFGERVRLARWEAPGALEPSLPLEVRLVWHALQTGGAPLRAFAQLFRDGEQVAVSDHFLDPPASAWISGEWIVDGHTLALPASLPAGEYRLVVGLYNPATGARLPTNEGEWATIARWSVP